MENEVSDNWYEYFFQGINCEMWEMAMPWEITRQEVDFLQGELNLSPGERILDIPCGLGRHAIELSKRGFNVTGVDISETFVQALSEKINAENLSVRVIQGDMLKVSLKNEFSAAICLGNSFGYFNWDKMNGFVEKVASSLFKGSKFIINSGMMAESILPNFQQYVKNNIYNIGNIVMEITNIYDASKSVLKSHLKYIKEGKTETHSLKHYVFTLADVSRILAKYGFQILATYNSLAKEEFKLGDQQVYIVAEKE